METHNLTDDASFNRYLLEVDILEKERGIWLASEWLKWLDTRPPVEAAKVASRMIDLL